jgi:hypothetical protein
MKKYMFLVYLGVILGYIVSKAGKLHNPKKISIIKNMATPKCLKTYKFSIEWPIFIDASSRTLLTSWPPS